MGRLKTRDWKRGTVHVKGVENATLKNAGPIYSGGGKCGSGKHATIIHGVENARQVVMERPSYKKCSKILMDVIVHC